jgi:hypothetical protein
MRARGRRVRIPAQADAPASASAKASREAALRRPVEPSRSAAAAGSVVAGTRKARMGNRRPQHRGDEQNAAGGKPFHADGRGAGGQGKEGSGAPGEAGVKQHPVEIDGKGAQRHKIAAAAFRLSVQSEQAGGAAKIQQDPDRQHRRGRARASRQQACDHQRGRRQRRTRQQPGMLGGFRIFFIKLRQPLQTRTGARCAVGSGLEHLDSRNAHADLSEKIRASDAGAGVVNIVLTE